MKWIILGLFTALVIIACSPSNSTLEQNPDTTQSNVENCRIIEHAVDTTEICGKPEKIVVLSPHHLDLLLSLGYEPAGYGSPYGIPGVSSTTDTYDNPADQIPYLGEQITTKPVNLGLGGEPSLEKLAALKPDVIFGEIRNEANYNLLKQIAPTLIWDIRTVGGQWQETIKDMAKALGDEERAEKAIADYEQEIASARQELGPVVAKSPKLLLLGMSRLQDQPALIQPDTYLGEVMQGVGFEIVSLPAQKTKRPTIPISVEALPQLNEADIIIVLGYNLSEEKSTQTVQGKSLESTLETNQLNTAKQSWQENKIAQSLQASQEDNVYFTTYYLWNGLNGPIGTKLILEQLKEFLL